MNDCHWYPFEPMVWLTDTLHLDAVTETAFARIQHFYYATGRPVPNDTIKLQNIGKVKSQDWARVYGELKQLGFYEDKIDGVNVLRHKRIDATLAEMDKKRAEQFNRTKAANEARNSKRNDQRNVVRDVPRNVERGSESQISHKTADQRNDQRNVERDVPRNVENNQKKNVTSDVTSDVTCHVTKSQLQQQLHKKGEAPALSKIDRISFERELKSINKELEKGSDLKDYTVGTKKYNRVKTLLDRQEFLRTQLGVVA